MLRQKTDGLFATRAKNARPWKLILAGVFVACAFGTVAFNFAWATDGAGGASTLIAGPVLLDEIDVNDDTEGDRVKLKTKGLWTSRVMHFHIAPGGHTGWHSHPGPVFVMIQKGTMTLTQANDLENPAVYPAGTGFVEDMHRVHIAANNGDEELEFEAFILIPLGAPVRVDEPAP